jgi:hypothetical protein
LRFLESGARLPKVRMSDVTMPPVIVRLPVPKLPILKVLEFVQLPPLTFTVPLLPVLLPTVPDVDVQTS